MKMPTSTQGGPVASWEDVRDGLRKLLDPWHQPESSSSQGITISNVRRLFQSHFQLELSVTALGHVRLLDLLKDPRLNDVCTVSTLKSGQFLVLRAHQSRPQQLRPAVPPGVWDPAACTGSFFSLPTLCVMPLALVPLALPQDTARAAWEDCSDCSGALLSPGSSPRNFSVPSLGEKELWKSSKACSSSSESTATSLDCSVSSVSNNETDESLESPRSLSSDSEVSASCNDNDLGGPWQIEVKHTFIDVRSKVACLRLAGGGARQRSLSMPA